MTRCLKNGIEYLLIMDPHFSQTPNQLLPQAFVFVCISEGVHATKVLQNFRPPFNVEK